MDPRSLRALDARDGTEVSSHVASLPDRPFATLVIPCLDEEPYIASAVRAAMSQTWPADRMEILVVDGGSSDCTRAIVLGLGLEDPRVRLLENPRRVQAAAMNVAILASRGDVICRMDAHAEYRADYLARSVEALRSTGALNAGGAARPKHKGGFQEAVCSALTSQLAFGGSAYRDPENEGFVESVFNGCFRREAFEIAGLFDPDAITNEDAEMNQRIIEAGGRVFLSRSIVTHYYPRASLAALARQYFAYGRGRARTLWKRGRALSPRPFVPFAALASFTALSFASIAAPWLRPIIFAALTAYALLILIEAARARARCGATLRVMASIALVFPVMHVCHGLGLGFGLVRFARLGSRGARVRLAAR